MFYGINLDRTIWEVQADEDKTNIGIVYSRTAMYICNTFPLPLGNNHSFKIIKNSKNMIERFVEAQNEVYSRALEEIKSRKKRTHWMWFIFPQIKGLGFSMTSIFFSIKDVNFLFYKRCRGSQGIS